MDCAVMVIVSVFRGALYCYSQFRYVAEMLYLNCGNTQYNFSIHKVLNSLNFQQIVNLTNSLIYRFALHH